ncbi:MAG: archease [Syntrophobacteraceae bacterium]
MPYRYLDDIATADAAFEARGQTIEEMFAAAADATMNVMVEDLGSIRRRASKRFDLEADDLEMLLFALLQELIFFKDAERLLLRVFDVRVWTDGNRARLVADTAGEEIDPSRHALIVDVKAVTLHKYRVAQTADGWEATVILDI